MKTKALLCMFLCLLLLGCASSSKKSSSELAKMKIGSNAEVQLKVGKPKPSDKAPEEEKSDRYGEKDENPILREQSVGVSASWKF